MSRNEPKDVEAALAHDLNNTLQVVMGNLEVLKRRGALAPEIVDAALNATRNAAHLADRLVWMGRLRNLEPRTLGLNAALTDLMEMLGRIAGDGIRVDLQLSGNVGAVRVDPRCLQIALLELATNAREAMPAGGRLTVRSAIEGGFAKVEVSDTGAGLSAERIRQPFEPVFGGSGGAKPVMIGLHLVERCMHLSGGRVEISSRASEGTTVTLYIPTE